MKDDNAIPLWDPFPLPKHYSKDVEDALQQKQMYSDVAKKFYSSIASAILAHKRYLTPSDFDSVGKTIISKYSFLSSPRGSPHVSLFKLCIILYHLVLCLLVGTHHIKNTSHTSPY